MFNPHLVLMTSTMAQYKNIILYQTTAKYIQLSLGIWEGWFQYPCAYKNHAYSVGPVDPHIGKVDPPYMQISHRNNTVFLTLV